MKAARSVARSEPVVVRSYQQDDLPALERCIGEMQEAERAIEPRLRAGAEIAHAYAQQVFERCTAYLGAILIAERGGQVAGFVAVLTRVPYENLDEPQGDYALVSELAVLEAQRRHGVGRALLAAAEEYARSHGAVELRIGVLAKNKPARQLYLGSGFVASSEMLAKWLR